MLHCTVIRAHTHTHTHTHNLSTHARAHVHSRVHTKTKTRIHTYTLYQLAAYRRRIHSASPQSRQGQAANNESPQDSAPASLSAPCCSTPGLPPVSNYKVQVGKAHKHTHTHACTHTHIHTRTHMHTHMHARTHTHTRAHTHTHTCTHTQSYH
jgi:hypothetical protein